LIGLALVLRDWLQELTDWKWAAFAVVFGSIISYFTSDPFVALASAVAFLSAETLDLLVYTPLRKSGKHFAVLVSGLVGAFVDSVLFVYLAFGSFEFSFGNTVGKLYATVAVFLFLYVRWKYATLSRDATDSKA
jgi:uncharacterized PurR-regulated membrane protein YhhQ (DUF165 family)